METCGVDNSVSSLAFAEFKLFLKIWKQEPKYQQSNATFVITFLKALYQYFTDTLPVQRFQNYCICQKHRNKEMYVFSVWLNVTPPQVTFIKTNKVVPQQLFNWWTLFEWCLVYWVQKEPVNICVERRELSNKDFARKGIFLKKNNCVNSGRWQFSW